MFKNLTYEKKFIAFCAVLFIFLIGIWKTSLSKTFDLISECNKLEESIASQNISNAELDEMKLEDKKLSRFIGNADRNPDDVKNKILSEILRYKEENEIEIIHFPEAHHYTEENHQVITNTLKVKGGFIELVKLNNHLEQTFNDSKISGVNYKLERNKRSRKNELYAEFYLQNINQLN